MKNYTKKLMLLMQLMDEFETPLYGREIEMSPQVYEMLIRELYPSPFHWAYPSNEILGITIKPTKAPAIEI